jgi:hypothetical protein
MWSEPILFGAQVPALKPVEAQKHDREREKNKMGFFEFFGRLHTKNSPKTDPFLEGIVQKTKKWHFGDVSIRAP